MSSWSNIKFFKRTTNQILEVRVWGGANQLILPTESNEKSSWISEIVWIPTKFNVLAVWLQKPKVRIWNNTSKGRINAKS